MSVEKMRMMNIIGQISDLDKVSMEIVKSGCVQIVNALNEINQNEFTIMTPNQNISILADFCYIRPYAGHRDITPLKERILELMDIYGIKRRIVKDYIEDFFVFEDIAEDIDNIYHETMEYQSRLQSLNGEIQKDTDLYEYIKNLQPVNIKISELKSMNYFEFKLCRMSKENYDKLNDNIENISSIIYGINSYPGYYIFISLTPRVLLAEVDKILKSLNYEEIDIPYSFKGTPDEIMQKLQNEIAEKTREADILNSHIRELKEKNSVIVDTYFSKLRMYEKLQYINGETACTNEFFYMAGWVPESQTEYIKSTLSAFGESLILVFKPQDEVSKSITPPTKLRNNWLVRPFESIVRMYGTPSYNEIDPTWFVALSYMLMFGYMFGDVGQGFIFLVAGIVLVRLFKRPNLGGILSRIGASSMLFGILFGSVFGDEQIINHPLIRPMDNIYTVLIGGVVIGIAFTTVGFIINLVNTAKVGDIEDGVFGKDGLAGLAFYWVILLTALSIYSSGNTPIPLSVIIVIIITLLLLMVFKQPLANVIKGTKPLYSESPGDYYIESGFGVLETMISMLSNTVSFIRVGAFALNHVGLFIAFATVAKMIKVGAGSYAVLVLGNIVIIALEGLVVFIQGLRLEYYELFSKYYRGDGEEYNPVALLYARRTVSHNAQKGIVKEHTESSVSSNTGI